MELISSLKSQLFYFKKLINIRLSQEKLQIITSNKKLKQKLAASN